MIKNRPLHASQLRAGLSNAIQALNDLVDEQKELNIPETKRGIAVTFEGRPNQNLVTGNRRATSPGMKLYTLQRRDQNLEEPVDRATFFLNENAAKTLFENLTDYGSYEPFGFGLGDFDGSNDDEDDDSGDAGRPRNFWLFETSTLIRPTTLSDYWTDDKAMPRGSSKDLWQVWIRRDLEKEFIRAARDLNLQPDVSVTEFIEVEIRHLSATATDMAELVRKCPAVVELKSASSLSSDFLREAPVTRVQNAKAIASRIVAPPQAAPRIAILDTGVSTANPMLQSSLDPNRCFSASNKWPVADHSDHGTRIAGVAQFYDLEYFLGSSGPINLTTRLESVVVAAPPGLPRLSGMTAIQRAVKALENERARRVYCLAQTAQGEAKTGRPTATSAAIDLLAYNDGSNPRLFCVAAGNVPTSARNPYQTTDYATRNSAHPVESPGQAANAITVGAVTFKSSQPGLVAALGDLTPTSRNAEAWSYPHATKPDIVMEGGNFKIDEDGLSARPSSDDLILTTSGLSPAKPFAVTGETSAATARASGLLARLHVAYPNMRPETLRGLLIHSAEWTPAMRAQQQEMVRQGKSQADAWEVILARYGWGLPDDARAYYSTENAFCMIVEDEIVPFEKPKDSIRIKEMKYFKLPWPKNTLRSLRNTQVEMKCTLSYFVEPDPQAISRDRPDRYRSFGLCFDVKRHDETDLNAEGYFNDLVHSYNRSPGDPGWLVGDKLSDRGTLQQDIWKGPAYQLAERDGISVSPIKGWWAEISKAKRVGLPVKFSLIVSIKAPVGNNLFAEVAANAANVLVEQPVVIPG